MKPNLEDDDRQAQLERELKEYLKTTKTTPDERRALRGWVKEGNSVYENGTEMSFLDDYRYWDEIFEEESHLSGNELSRFEADLCHKSLEEYLQWFKDCFEVLVSFLKSNGLWDEAWAAVEEMENERDKESWKPDDSGARQRDGGMSKRKNKA